MSNQTMKFCKTCNTQTIHLAPSTSHVLHLLLTLVTFGFWGIVWLIVYLNNTTQSSCTKCGRFNGIFGSGTSGIATGASPQTHVKCPDCAELILKEAKVCKHCGCKLIPSE